MKNLNNLNDNLKKNLGTAFLLFIIPFVILSILSIWEFVGSEVIWKSVSTIAVLFVSTLLAIGILEIVKEKNKK